VTTLILENIDKKFGPVEAVSGVNLEIREGEFCVLLGPSGCGKSTLLQIISGLTLQDKGSVIMDGSPVDHLSPRDRNIAMVFQSYALYPHMTVEQNMAFGLKMRGVEKRKIKGMVLETAKLLEIEELLERKPRQLSGGQRQRVAMGRALVRRPRLFLLDEPLSNLDAQLRVNVRLELRKLHEKIRATMIYVTHDQIEAMTLGDKIAVMQKGKIHQIGRPEEVYEKPEDKFVASFLGSPGMNFLSGKIVKKKGRMIFHRKDFTLALGPVSPSLDGMDVEMGIRPEDILIGDENRPEENQARIDTVSHVGSEKYVHVILGGKTMTIVAPKDASFSRQELIPVYIPKSKIHIFKNGVRV
jgi:ABC-type sugar transport system ATPase subunit